jgi:hypothetical protein
MNARYYDPVTGQFVSPDTLVPDATNLFDYNRYMYVRGNPLKYTDPTGHLSEDELRALLGQDYDNLMAPWRTYDPHWIAALEAIEGGGVLQATVMGDAELHFEGSGSAIRLQVYNGQASDKLWDWQGKGAYRIKNVGVSDADADVFRDQLFERFETSIPNTVFSPVFDYHRRKAGLISPAYYGARITSKSVGEWRWSSATIEAADLVGLPQPVGVFGDIVVPGVATVVLSLGFGGGLALESLNVGLGSIAASYRGPANYATGWSGGGDVNPHIELAEFEQ